MLVSQPIATRHTALAREDSAEVNQVITEALRGIKCKAEFKKLVQQYSSARNYWSSEKWRVNNWLSFSSGVGDCSAEFNSVAKTKPDRKTKWH
jgi:hypothetical protein